MSALFCCSVPDASRHYLLHKPSPAAVRGGAIFDREEARMIVFRDVPLTKLLSREYNISWINL